MHTRTVCKTARIRMRVVLVSSARITSMFFICFYYYYYYSVGIFLAILWASDEKSHIFSPSLSLSFMIFGFHSECVCGWKWIGVFCNILTLWCVLSRQQRDLKICVCVTISKLRERQRVWRWRSELKVVWMMFIVENRYEGSKTHCSRIYPYTFVWASVFGSRLKNSNHHTEIECREAILSGCLYEYMLVKKALDA